ncbi:MAG: hypothetical protein ABFD16_27185 [Thermoguttaceae bacterium]
MLRCGGDELPPGKGPEDDCRRLCNELMRVMLAQQLFTFVMAEPVQKPNGEMLPVAGTNNEAERTLRAPDQARVTGRFASIFPPLRSRA